MVVSNEHLIGPTIFPEVDAPVGAPPNTLSAAYHSSEAPWAACRCPGCAEECDMTRDRDTDTAAVSICPRVTMDLKFRHQGF